MSNIENAKKALLGFYKDENHKEVDVDWLLNEAQLQLSNTEALYKLMLDTETTSTIPATKALVTAVNTKSDVYVSLQEIKDALAELNVNYDDVINNLVNYVEEQRQESLTEGVKTMAQKYVEFCKKLNLDSTDYDDVLSALDEMEGMFGDPTGQYQELREYIHNELMDNTSVKSTNVSQTTNNIAEIYQVQQNRREVAFMSLEYVDSKNLFNFSNYEKVATIDLDDLELDNKSDMEKLEAIFDYGNNSDIYYKNNPQARSISVSDIIKLDNKYYYCDSFGFVDVTSRVLKTESVEPTENVEKTQDTVTTLEQRKNAILRLITKYQDKNAPQEKIDELNQELKDVERDIWNYSNPDKPMKMQEGNKEDFESDMAHIEEFLNNKEGYATQEAEQILDILYDNFINLSSSMQLDESSKCSKNEELSIDKYEVTLISDGGKEVNITTTASSKEAAIKNVCNAENAPESAVKSVKKLSDMKEQLDNKNIELEEVLNKLLEVDDLENNTLDDLQQEDTEEDTEEPKTILDSIQDLIGQEISVAEFNNSLQSIFGMYNRIFLLDSDLYNMDLDQTQELVVDDDEDMYVINYNIIDVFNAIIEVTDVNIE